MGKTWQKQNLWNRWQVLSTRTKSESERVLEAVVDVLKQALQRGEKIDLRGLGVFKVRETKPRQARNPRTGEALL